MLTQYNLEGKTAWKLFENGTIVETMESQSGWFVQYKRENMTDYFRTKNFTEDWVDWTPWKISYEMEFLNNKKFKVINNTTIHKNG